METFSCFVKRGCFFGIFVFLLHKLFLFLLEDYFGAINFGGGFLSALVIMGVFTFVAVAFAGVKSAGGCLAIMFMGGVSVLACELALTIAMPFLRSLNLDVYKSGTLAWVGMYSFVFFGCTAGALIAFIVALCDKDINLVPDKTNEIITRRVQIKITVYTVFTAITAVLFLLPSGASMGTVIFVLLQFIALIFVLPEKRRIFMLVPMVVFSVGGIISTNTDNKVLNVILCAMMYGALASGFSFKESIFAFMKRSVGAVAVPFMHILRPIGWNKDKMKIKGDIGLRIAVGVLITIPCVAALLSILARIDGGFLKWMENIFGQFLKYINMGTVLYFIFALFIALYLAGAVYAAHVYKDKPVLAKEKRAIKCDLVILNIVLGAVLLVYTAFGAFQFGYLFAAIGLNGGFDYASYARNGFFELVVLSCLNIVLALIISRVVHNRMGKGALICRIFSVYLCVITIVLILSSFYRMYMYCGEYGLSRARIYVMVFLFFEFAAVVMTIVYLIKPEFNICILYIFTAFIYYLTMNVVPVDALSAHSQVKRYLNGDGDADIRYVTDELSVDGASELFVLLEDDKTDNETKAMIEEYFKEIDERYKDYGSDWRKFNFSAQRYLELRYK